MLPTKEQLKQHLKDKMTNQNIAEIYGTTRQKIIPLTKKYGLNQKELRKVGKTVVYEHWHNGEVVYVGSGVWYRMRRHTNKRHPEQKQLMKEGQINYKIVAEYSNVQDARVHEMKLIQMYKKLGLAKYNRITS